MLSVSVIHQVVNVMEMLVAILAIMMLGALNVMLLETLPGQKVFATSPAYPMRV
jgi:hypothetical protein